MVARVRATLAVENGSSGLGSTLGELFARYEILTQPHRLVQMIDSLSFVVEATIGFVIQRPSLDGNAGIRGEQPEH